MLSWKRNFGERGQGCAEDPYNGMRRLEQRRNRGRGARVVWCRGWLPSPPTYLVLTWCHPLVLTYLPTYLPTKYGKAGVHFDNRELLYCPTVSVIHRWSHRMLLPAFYLSEEDVGCKRECFFFWSFLLGTQWTTEKGSCWQDIYTFLRHKIWILPQITVITSHYKW